MRVSLRTDLFAPVTKIVFPLRFAFGSGGVDICPAKNCSTPVILEVVVVYAKFEKQNLRSSDCPVVDARE